MAKKNKRPAKERAKEMFTAKNIARMAVFTALAYLLYFPIFEFSLIPAVPFLKIDFSNAFVMMAGFALGPIAGVIVGVLKELLHAVTFSQTVGVGELANIIIMLPYIIIPSIVYLRRRNIKTVFATLAIACVAQAVWSVPVNYLLTFPFFLMAYAGASSWTAGMEFYLDVWQWAVLFNFVKTLLISAAVLILYKQFQRLFSYIFREKRKGAPVKAAGDTDGAQVSAQSDMSGESFGGSEEVYTVASPEEMQELGKKVAGTLKGGEVLLLSGELGAGKTVFCKGLAKGLGVAGEVLSPTFTLLNEHTGNLKFNHIDAYRLASADEAEAAGLSEYINGDGVCAVEWWENIEGMFDGLETVSVTIVKIDGKDGVREVKIKR